MWYNETDNIKALKKINNYVFMPLIGHEGQTNGIIQLFNFRNPITRLQVRKYNVIGKFLGSCLENVTMKNQNLETIVGMDLMLEGLGNVNQVCEA